MAKNSFSHWFARRNLQTAEDVAGDIQSFVERRHDSALFLAGWKRNHDLPKPAAGDLHHALTGSRRALLNLPSNGRAPEDEGEETGDYS